MKLDISVATQCLRVLDEQGRPVESEDERELNFLGSLAVFRLSQNA